MTPSKMSVKEALHKLEEASDSATEAIKDAIAREAIRCQLTEVKMLMWENVYLRGTHQVRNAKIDKLSTVYSDNVHSAGLYGMWNNKTGWA